MTDEQLLQLSQHQQAIINFQAELFVKMFAEMESLKFLMLEMSERLGMDKRALDARFKLLCEQAENRVSEFPVPKLPLLDEPD
jgi:hypothetical protein